MSSRSSAPYRRDPGWRHDADHKKKAPKPPNSQSHRRPDNRHPRTLEKQLSSAPLTAAQAAVQAAALMPPPSTPITPIMPAPGGSHSLQWVPNPPPSVTIDLTTPTAPAVPAPPAVASVVNVPTFCPLNQRNGEKRMKKSRRTRV